MEAIEIALTLAENIDQLDGHEPWKPIDSDGHTAAHRRGESTAYIEVLDKETGEESLVYLTATRKPVEPPTFDDGAGDRAHEARVDDKSGVL